MGFEKWWIDHQEMFQIVNKDKQLVKGIYESAIMDAVEFLKEERNVVSTTGLEIASGLYYAAFGA